MVSGSLDACHPDTVSFLSEQAGLINNRLYTVNIGGVGLLMELAGVIKIQMRDAQ